MFNGDGFKMNHKWQCMNERVVFYDSEADETIYGKKYYCENCKSEMSEWEDGVLVLNRQRVFDIPSCSEIIMKNILS